MPKTSSQIRDIEALTRRVTDDGPDIDRRRQRRSRLRRLTWLAVPLVVIMIAVVSARTSKPERVSAGTADRSPFVSPTRTLLPIVFPDGSSADLIYPKNANLDAQGFSPRAAVYYSPYEKSPEQYGQSQDRPDRTSAHPCCNRELTIKRGPIRDVMGGRTPTKVYTGARGQDVLFFDSISLSGASNELPQLGFQFGSWTVLAFDYPVSDPRGVRMTDEQRAVLASSLDGEENNEGFLLLEPHRPLCLQSPKGPDGELGDAPSNKAVMLYLHPQPHGAYAKGTEKTAQGYDVANWSSYHTSLLLPDKQFELALPNDLRWLKDDVHIANLKHEARWRC